MYWAYTYQFNSFDCETCGKSKKNEWNEISKTYQHNKNMMRWRKGELKFLHVVKLIIQAINILLYLN